MALVRLLRDILIRLVLVFLAASFFIFLALDRPILRQIYDVARHFQEFVFHVPSQWEQSAELVGIAYARSIVLLASALVVGLLFGVPLGVIASVRPNSLWARFVSILGYTGILVPSFLFGLAVMVFFIRYLGKYTGGIQFILLRPTDDILSLRHLIAPGITLAARPIAYISLVTATALREELASDYVRTAHSKGLAGYQVLLTHIWPNVVARIVGAANDSVLFLLSSLAIVEFLFSWPGVGRQFFEHVLKRDAQTASFLLASVGVTLVLLNAAVEVINRWLDPRLRRIENW